MRGQSRQAQRKCDKNRKDRLSALESESADNYAADCDSLALIAPDSVGSISSAAHETLNHQIRS